MSLALMDTETNTLLGNDDGAFVIPDQEKAEQLADLVAERMGWSRDRVAIVPHRASTHKRDTVAYTKDMGAAADAVFLRKLVEATGIPEDRLKRIMAGRTIQTAAENARLQAALAAVS